jgi:hypothetical protein
VVSRLFFKFRLSCALVIYIIYYYIYILYIYYTGLNLLPPNYISPNRKKKKRPRDARPRDHFYNHPHNFCAPVRKIFISYLTNDDTDDDDTDDSEAIYIDNYRILTTCEPVYWAMEQVTCMM